MPQYQLLEPIMLPLVNKFYRAEGARGKANANHKVWVAREKREIIGALKLERFYQQTFLSGVYVCEGSRGQGIAKCLLSASLESEEEVITFAYRHLTPLYCSLGFEISEEGVHAALLAKYENYRRQGRDVICMRYQKKGRQGPF